MSFEATITEVMKIMEDAKFFKPASYDQQSLRLYPNDPVAREKYAEELEKYGGDVQAAQGFRFRQEEIRRMEARRREMEEYNARLANMPFTYDDIVQLPEYQRIVALPGVEDKTPEAMQRRRALKIVLDLGKYKMNYHLKTNGYIHVMDVRHRGFGESNYPLRSPSRGSAYTLEEYKGLLNQMYAILTRRINKEKRLEK